VQGHVDETGAIVRRTPSEHWELVEVSFSSHIAAYLVEKGSVTVDGVSLTIVSVDDDAGTFTVSLIPETLARTTLGSKVVGEPVNLEVDVIAKYVERMLTVRRTAPTADPAQEDRP
jgi:riboflavin synthase